MYRNSGSFTSCSKMRLHRRFRGTTWRQKQQVPPKYRNKSNPTPYKNPVFPYKCYQLLKHNAYAWFHSWLSSSLFITRPVQSISVNLNVNKLIRHQQNFYSKLLQTRGTTFLPRIATDFPTQWKTLLYSTLWQQSTGLHISLLLYPFLKATKVRI